MQPTQSAQSFLPFADDYSPPRSRTTAASIWAPQPQQVDSTWPNTTDSFPRDAEKTVFRTQRGLRGLNTLFGSQDVFGTVGLLGPPRKRDIGAIGDGRKRQTPEFDDDARLFSRCFRRIYSPCNPVARRTALARAQPQFPRAPAACPGLE